MSPKVCIPRKKTNLSHLPELARQKAQNKVHLCKLLSKPISLYRA